MGIKRLGFSIHLDTVALPLLNENNKNFPLVEMSKAIDLIGIPVDGASENVIQCFRAGADDFKTKLIKILRILNANNFKISVNTVAHKDNILKLQEIYDFITDFPTVVRWELHQFVALSNKAKSVRGQFEMEETEFIRECNKITNHKNIIISPKPNKNKMNFMYLEFNGDVIKLTNGIKVVLTNIRDHDFNDILEFKGVLLPKEAKFDKIH